MFIRSYSVAVLFDSPGVSSQLHIASQLPFFRGSDHTTLLDSLRNELALQFKQVCGFDEAAEPLWSVLRSEETGTRKDLPVVAEERSDDEMLGAVAMDVEETGEYSQREDRVAGRAYSCEHCHCSVCKRSLEHHDCQRSYSSSEHEVMSDEAGGSVTQSLVICVSCLHFTLCKILPSLRISFLHSCYNITAVRKLLLISSSSLLSLF